MILETMDITRRFGSLTAVNAVNLVMREVYIASRFYTQAVV